MIPGKTIQIFLPDGNPRGVKIAEITSRTVQAILIPRSKLEYAAQREELGQVGVYFLIGSTEDDDKPVLYIGEAENCRDRLRSHNKNKEFWTNAVAVVSKTAFFTKSHVKYLEWYCHQQAKKANRFQVENSNVPTKSYIPEAAEADLLDNFDTIKTLVATLGYPMFEAIERPPKAEVLICKGKDAYAEGRYTEDGLVVFKGGKCRLKETPSCSPSIARKRKQLVEKGVLTQEGNHYVFTQDWIFKSPSGASCAVLGANSNGWICWKYKNGKTLSDASTES